MEVILSLSVVTREKLGFHQTVLVSAFILPIFVDQDLLGKMVVLALTNELVNFRIIIETRMNHCRLQVVGLIGEVHIWVCSHTAIMSTILHGVLFVLDYRRIR